MKTFNAPTTEQIELIQETFSMVAGQAAAVAQLFYQRLFELDPALRPMFPPSLELQGEKLMTMLATAVNSLQRPQSLEPVLEGLGRRHAGYGVRDRDYETVGAALLWTLNQGLGRHFTPVVEQAWATLYGFIAGTMQKGSRANASSKAVTPGQAEIEVEAEPVRALTVG